MGSWTSIRADLTTPALKTWRPRAALLVLILGLCLPACTEPISTPAPVSSATLDGSSGAQQALTNNPRPGATPSVSTPFDVGAVIRQVHFAYRPAEVGGFEGGHATYGVTVRGGAVSVTPVHHPPAGQVDAVDISSHEPHTDPNSHVNRPEPVTGAPATFTTTAMARGGVQVMDGLASASVDKDGSLAMSRGAVTEQLRNSDEGVEQSWRFPRRPDGSGDLTVRVRVSGQRFVGRTAHGLHFEDPATGIGVRYGQATWIDAGGKRSALSADFQGGAVVITVPAALVEASAYPALLDPVISPEYGLNTSVQAPAWNNQRLPAVASDGTDYLVVWDDYRHLKYATYDIYAARVSSAGKVLDPGGVRVSSAANNQVRPAVAFDGTRYLVAWYDYRNNATYPDIYGSRISKSGTVLDPVGITISTASSYQYNPRIAVGGGNFLVAWQDYRSGSYANVYGARVSPAGVVLDKKGFLISGASHHQSAPDLAFDGTNFLVVWMDYRKTSGKYTRVDIYGARVSTSGTLLDKNGFKISTNGVLQYYPSISYSANGATFLVVWQEYRNLAKTYWDIVGQTVTTTATLKGTNVMICKASGDQSEPTVAHDGSDFMVAWRDNRSSTASNIYGARVTVGGALVTGSEVAISQASGTQYRPSIAWAKSGYLVAWEDGRNHSGSNYDIYGARLTGAGALKDPAGILISTSGGDQSRPAVAHDGTNYLVVWQEKRNYVTTRTDLYGALVSASGSLVTSSGITISKAANDQLYPAVTYGGGKYLVVWEDRRSGTNIYGTQVGTTGTVSHPSGVPISAAAGNQQWPAVASDGSGYLVVWQDYRNNKSYPDVYGTRVSGLGAVVDASGIAIAKASFYQQTPAVAYGVGSYLVVWMDYRNYKVSNWDIHGARVSTAGKVLDTNSIVISDQIHHQQYPAVAHDNANFMVVWQDQRNSVSGTSWDIHGARVSSAGNLFGSTKAGFSISVSGGDQLRPRVASSTSSFLAVWKDYRGGKHNPDIYGTLISSAGTVKSKLGYTISTDSDYDIAPNVTSPGAGKYMVVYSRFSAAASEGAFRVKARFLTELNKGGLACTTGKACVSGFCVDGVCCDVACGGGSTGDCQACSVASGGKVNGTCGPVMAGATCRATAGQCDTAETCDGATLTCPTNVFTAKGTTCRGALGLCDKAETCSGSSALCPADVRQPAGTSCRKVAGKCDKAETCDGTSAACPTDAVLPSGSPCRPIVGTCDVAETCSGQTAVCPTDLFKGSTNVCRAAAGECDLSESCSGASAICPADLFKVDNTTCSKGMCIQGKCLPPDMGPPDMGPDASPDGGSPDGSPDLSSPDATLTPDKAVAKPDSKSVGAEGTTEEPGESEGCECNTGHAGDGGPLSAMLLMLLALLRRSRK